MRAGRRSGFRSISPTPGSSAGHHPTETEAEARAAALKLADHLHQTQRLAVYAVTAFLPDEIDRLWQLRETVLPGLYGLRGGPQPVAFVEDVGVPPEELHVYLHRDGSI